MAIVTGGQATVTVKVPRTTKRNHAADQPQKNGDARTIQTADEEAGIPDQKKRANFCNSSGIETQRAGSIEKCRAYRSVEIAYWPAVKV